MEAKDIIEWIINIPCEYYALKNISFYTLLKNTGYFKINYEIDEADIVEALRNRPEIVQYWIQWSEDKRTDSGWYIEVVNSGRYIVGYYPANRNKKPKNYSDKIEACAAFIKREIQSIKNGSIIQYTEH